MPVTGIFGPSRTVLVALGASQESPQAATGSPGDPKITPSRAQGTTKCEQDAFMWKTKHVEKPWFFSFQTNSGDALMAPIGIPRETKANHLANLVLDLKNVTSKTAQGGSPTSPGGLQEQPGAR